MGKESFTTQNIGYEEIDIAEARRIMMAWEAKEKGYTCNDCYLAMQNCHDMSICCEDESGLCDWFEKMEEQDD